MAGVEGEFVLVGSRDMARTGSAFGALQIETRPTAGLPEQGAFGDCFRNISGVVECCGFNRIQKLGPTAYKNPLQQIKLAANRR